MTTSLLVFSASDLAYEVSTFSIAASFFCMVFETSSKYTLSFTIEPNGVYIYSGHVSRMPYILSNLTITYLAVARCLCVAKPILFKNMFGVKLTVYLLITFGVFSVISYLPVLDFIDMSPQYSALINATRVSLWVSPNRQLVIKVVWVYRDDVMPFVNQIIISIFEVGSTLQHSDLAFSFKDGRTAFKRQQIENTSTLSVKDYQVLQQVVTISVISTYFVIVQTV
ncbi:fMet-Leu-Phe receptor [Biomphalaria glabrata]|nr:fMet-Leu-Phe receptor [Biomphalaria glabrata]